MKTILNAIRDLGLDPADITVQATLQHLPAGTKEHYTGEQVQVFEPAFTAVRFMHPSQDAPVLAWCNSCQEMADKEAYLDHLKTGQGIDPSEARQLLTGLTEHHHAITGQRHSTHSMIEIDPVRIEAILSASENIEIGLAPLVRFIEIDDALFDAIVTDDNDTAKLDKLEFEKFSLTSVFQKSPCDSDLFTDLRREYVEGRHIGLGMGNYYNWFRKSEALFEPAGGLSEVAKDLFNDGLKAWASTEENLTPTKLEDKQKMARHNFRVHPHHAPLIDAYVREIALAHAPNAAENLKEVPSMRPGARKNTFIRTL